MKLSPTLFCCLWLTLSFSQSEFITTWKTDNPGVSGDNQITIPTLPEETYNYTVDWGDGTIDTTVIGSITHTYTDPGTYQVAISGIFPFIYFNNEGDKEKILSIDQWGTIEWSTFMGSFHGCSNLDVLAIDAPQLSKVTSLERMFNNCLQLTGNPSFNNWDVSSVSNMSVMFSGANNFNADIGGWDVSSVIYMAGMFRYNYLFNQDIGNWDVSNVTDMSFLFEGASSFNQNISNWDVSGVTNMFRTFTGATLFNQPIGNWNVSNVTSMEMMFWNAVNFNQPLNNWNVSEVTTMKEMFFGSLSFNQDINNWDVSNVVTMPGMFAGASSFNKGLNSWNTNRVNNMNGMFFEADNFNQPIDNWDLRSATNLRAMFFGADAFNQPISNWDVSSVTDMSSMFERATSFSQNLGNWNIAQVVTMQNMFNDAGISQTNYDSTLIEWSSKSTLKNNIQFNGGNSTFCAGEGARLKLINDYGWEIIDGGKANCPFITTWKTDNTGVSAENRISIPIIRNTAGYNYNYSVNWGDGSIDTNVTSGISHTYQNPGTYQVAISGDFPAINFYNLSPEIGDEQKIIAVNQWGPQQWKSMQGAFYGCTNLDILATDVPDLSNVTSMRSMFHGCEMLIGNTSFSNWDTSNVEDLAFLFSGTHKFNEDIGSWDVSKVRDMSGTFINAYSFNQNIGNWNVSNVEDMNGMFSRAFAFNHDIGKWDVSKVIRMGAMFFMAETFNQGIGNWNTQAVHEMDSMFNLALSFNRPIGKWNVSNVTGMNAMFSESNFDQDISEWDIQNVENLDQLFYLSEISQENYDLLLSAWSNLPNIKSDLVFNAGSSQFCNGEEGRQKLQSDFGWIIIDGGKVPFCNEDNDLDGVLDHKDNCLDTKPNVTVNENGCEIIPSNAILVNGSTPTCPGESNGSIAISSSLVDYVFNISIDGPISSELTNSSLNEPLEISNLSTGPYIINISIPEISYSQTYGIQINEVGSISGKRDHLDTKAKSVSYKVEGSHSYKVDLNGSFKTFQFETDGFNEIRLSDLSDFNTITISGESDCQGKITDSFSFSDGIVIYPTITKSSIYMKGYKEQSTVLVYDSSGRLLLSKKLTQQNLESVDLNGLEPGLYPTVIESKGTSKTFKIIKQ